MLTCNSPTIHVPYSMGSQVWCTTSPGNCAHTGHTALSDRRKRLFPCQMNGLRVRLQRAQALKNGGQSRCVSANPRKRSCKLNMHIHTRKQCTHPRKRFCKFIMHHDIVMDTSKLYTCTQVCHTQCQVCIALHVRRWWMSVSFSGGIFRDEG